MSSVFSSLTFAEGCEESGKCHWKKKKPCVSNGARKPGNTPGNTLVQIFRRIYAYLPFHVNNLSIGIFTFFFSFACNVLTSPIQFHVANSKIRNPGKCCKSIASSIYTKITGYEFTFFLTKQGPHLFRILVEFYRVTFLTHSSPSLDVHLWLHKQT